MIDGKECDLNNLDKQAKLKKLAGEEACIKIEDGMVLGLGTGSTVKWTIRKLGAMVKDGLDIVGIPTSEWSRKLAEEFEVPLTTLLDHPVIDLTINGADEVDPN